MIVSLQMLKNSMENYKKNKGTREQSKIETFQWSGKSMKKGVGQAFDLFILIIAIIFFIFELVLLYFAIYISIYCSKSKEERIVNFVLAITFTTPYVLLNILFNDCAKSYLRGGMKPITSS